MEAELAIVQQKLHQVLTRDKPAKPSRRVLSTARYVRRGHLEHARHARLAEDEKKLGKRKAATWATASNKRQRRVQDQDEDVIQAHDSEVEQQVMAIANAELAGGSYHGGEIAIERAGKEVPQALSEVSGNTTCPRRQTRPGGSSRRRKSGGG